MNLVFLKWKLLLKIWKDILDTGQIPTEIIQAGGNILCSELHNLTNSIWNKEELPQQWKESIIIPIYWKGGKTACSNYGGRSLLSSAYKILSNILTSNLILYIDEIVGDH